MHEVSALLHEVSTLAAPLTFAYVRCMKSLDLMQPAPAVFIADGLGPVATPAETMRRLRCGKTRLYELLAAGEIKSIKSGRSRLIFQRSVDAYLARLDVEQNGCIA